MADREKRPWRRLRPGRRVLIGVGVMVAAAVAWSLIMSAQRFRREIDSYVGLTLNVSPSETEYRLGIPTWVDTDAPGGPLTIDEKLPNMGLPAGKKITDYTAWLYSRSDGSEVDIYFDNKREKVVGIACYGKKGYCPSLLGVSLLDTEEELHARLGKPTRANIEAGEKAMNYRDIGAAFIAARGRVIGMAIGQKKEGGELAIWCRFAQSLLPG